MTTAQANCTSERATSLLVVIVSYRATELTIDCLRSLRGEISSIPGAKVAICENGTSQDAAKKLAETIKAEGWGDWVSLIAIHPNRGYAGGNNVILREAMAQNDPPEYLLLLNADTIVRPNAVRLLLDAIEGRPDVGIVSPRLEAEDGGVHVSCFRFPSPVSELLRAAGTGPITRLFKRYDVALPLSDQPMEPEWTGFACALIRRTVLAQIGLLDEGFYLYFDDPDYCRRARQAGWGVLHCPQSRVVHLIGQSNPVESASSQRRRRPRYYYASRTRYFAKFYGWAGLWSANLMWTAGRSIALARELVGNKAKHACDKEWRDIWTNAFRPMAEPDLSSIASGTA